jgi:hypothetical protein
MKSTTPFVKRYFKKLSGRVILLLLLIAGAVFLFGIIKHEVLWEKEEELDRHVFKLF